MTCALRCVGSDACPPRGEQAGGGGRGGEEGCTVAVVGGEIVLWRDGDLVLRELVLSPLVVHDVEQPVRNHGKDPAQQTERASK